jgi:hypothetical protein
MIVDYNSNSQALAQWEVSKCLLQVILVLVRRRDNYLVG